MPRSKKNKNDECEKAIRHLCGEWAKGVKPEELVHPSFTSFKNWLAANGYSHYLAFRSVAGSEYDAERWFDEEFKQAWRI